MTAKFCRKNKAIENPSINAWAAWHKLSGNFSLHDSSVFAYKNVQNMYCVL